MLFALLGDHGRRMLIRACDPMFVSGLAVRAGRWTHYNCATSIVDIFPDGSIKVLQINSTTHIDPELVSYGDLGVR